MAERFSLTDGLIDSQELIERAVAALRDGKLIMAMSFLQMHLIMEL